jgi:hypothetical protein
MVLSSIQALNLAFNDKINTSRLHLGICGTNIYMAFAENPFVTSTGIPATAR